MGPPTKIYAALIDFIRGPKSDNYPWQPGLRIQSEDRRELIFSILAILTVIVFGTLGYMTLENWSLFDSIYMTVITLSTIGYGEVHPLSPSGRAFTLVLIIIGVGVASVVFVSVARRVIEHQVNWLFRRTAMEDIITNLKNHIVFCGYSRLARLALVELKDSKRPLVVIEQNPDRVKQAIQDGLLVYNGDATSDEALLAAGVEHAKQLVTLLPTDADNMYVVLTARELNHNLFIISRSEEEAGEKRLRRAGANRIISPYRVGGQKIAYGIMRPYVDDFLELAATNSKTDFHIEEITVPPDSPLHGKTLHEAALRQKANVIVAAIISPNGKMSFNPSGDTIIEADSTLIGLGPKDDFIKLSELVVGK